MLRHWPLCAISEKSSYFMYKGTSSLYTPNTVESHDTCIGLRKSYWIIIVIWYRGSSSGSDPFIGFVSPSGSYLSYTVNKHKSMTINTLFVINLFLIIKNTTKGNTCSEKCCTRCVGQARKVLRDCYANWTSWMGYRDMSISISNFLKTNLHLIIAQRNVMDSHRPLINSSKSN